MNEPGDKQTQSAHETKPGKDREKRRAKTAKKARQRPHKKAGQRLRADRICMSKEPSE